MKQSPTRRQLLRAGAVAGAVSVAGCKSQPDGASPESNGDGLSWEGPGSSGGESGSDGAPVDVRGAIYLPTRAFNIYQMWSKYDESVIERDFGYAERVNLNALRVWLSYGWWNQDEKDKERKLEHLLTTADEKGMQVLVGLFDSVGKEANSETLHDTDLDSATAVNEPGDYVVEDRDHWSGVRRYVNWFMDRYRNDDRLLGISVMNEPGWDVNHLRFARGMFDILKNRKGSVPLTVGSTSLINSARFVDWGADIVQFHYNFPRNRKIVEDLLQDANELETILEKPVWLTEWQRVRSSGGGFGAAVEGEEAEPNYASLAPALREAGVGSFFWSLMVKPAWTTAQREHGVINGLFHEDGAVWSAEDARAIKSMSGDSSFDGKERSERPEWMRRDGGGGNETDAG